MNQSNKTDQQVFDKIRAMQLVPKARWHFLVRNYAIWAAGFLALTFGAISVALSLHLSLHNDPEIFPKFGQRPFELILLVVPFFWLICLAGFISLLYFDIKHTKKGYRYSLPMILLVTILANLVLGGVFYLAGAGEKVDDLLSRNAPFYDQVINPRIRYWSNPKEGRLSGLITADLGRGEFKLVDLKREAWLVSTLKVDRKPGLELSIGHPARFAGQITADHQFSASDILPIRSGRKFFERFSPTQPPLPAPPLFFTLPKN